LLGEKKKRKKEKTHNRRYTHLKTERRWWSFVCTQNLWAAGVLWLVLQHGPQQDGRRRNRSSRPYWPTAGFP
jgi:hypothetical protein